MPDEPSLGHGKTGSTTAEKLGLDGDIERGSGSVAAVQAIDEGRFDFGMANSVHCDAAGVRRPLTVALAACAYDATMGIGVLNGLRPYVS